MHPSVTRNTKHFEVSIRNWRQFVWGRPDPRFSSPSVVAINTHLGNPPFFPRPGPRNGESSFTDSRFDVLALCHLEALAYVRVVWSARRLHAGSERLAKICVVAMRSLEFGEICLDEGTRHTSIQQHLDHLGVCMRTTKLCKPAVTAFVSCRHESDPPLSLQAEDSALQNDDRWCFLRTPPSNGCYGGKHRPPPRRQCILSACLYGHFGTEASHSGAFALLTHTTPDLETPLELCPSPTRFISSLKST